MKFPTIKSKTLNKNEYQLPNDLRGEYNVVIVAFTQYHQRDVDTWIPFLQILERDNSNIHYYELPTVNNRGPLFRFYLDGIMRGGIRDFETRERTITLYTNVKDFCNGLNINPSQIYTYLIDKKGEILFFVAGRFSDKKGDDLLSLVNKLND